VFWSILHRTIIWELLRIFLMALVGLTGMLLMAGIIQEATQHGLSPGQIFTVIPLLIPSTLPYTIPATTLFATCVVYGRLAHDNEILAIKAAGINVLSIVSPAIILGLAMTALTVFLYYDMIPSTHWMMRAMVMDDVEEFLYGVLRREHVIRHPRLNYSMSVFKVEGRMLIDPVFVRRDPKTKTEDITARAEEAQLRVDLHKKLILFDMRRCWVTPINGDAYWIESKVWPVELPEDIFGSGKKTRSGDMNWIELLAFEEELRQQKEKVDTELALVMELSKTKDNLGDHAKNLLFASKQKLNDIRNVETEMAMRPALSLGCLCFVVIGCPVGIWFSKSDYLSAFITCFLPVVFIYYPLLLCGANLARTGKCPPVIAVGMADALMALAALPLYRKLLKN
jgi:lipopolysaccharide export system permease protein